MTDQDKDQEGYGSWAEVLDFGNHEQRRLIVIRDHLRRHIDGLCDLLEMIEKELGADVPNVSLSHVSYLYEHLDRWRQRSARGRLTASGQIVDYDEKSEATPT